MNDRLEYGSEVSMALADHQARMTEALDAFNGCAPVLAEAASLLVTTLRAGNKVMVAGNGGSAAEAQHFSAELIGRFMRDRDPYAALALTTDTSILTAVGNDYAFDDVFSRQVAGLGRPGDMFVAYSTSGESENLIRAADVAKSIDIQVVAVTGPHPSRLGDMADLAIVVPASNTPVVQELHMAITHLLCEIAEREMSAAGSRV
jgi:D-sedoheptulose 7-phosphate isomerase